MGAEPWDYYVPYREDVAAALEDLKRQEFAAGRYNKGYMGKSASTISEALANSGADGTRSILDMEGVSESPHDAEGDDPQLGRVAPLSHEQLIAFLGTDKPSRAEIEEAGGFPEWVDRGMGIYIIAYDGGKPSEIYFGGYSYD